MLIGESNVAIDPAIGGYGVADIYLGEFSPHSPLPGTQAGSSANLLLKSTSSYHMDLITELHPLVEGHLMDARVQGE